MSDFEVIELPRGGLWMKTPVGPVQLGAPPETIKDTLTREGGVPRVVILPRVLVDVRRGRSLADIEFPIYFNLFVKQRPLIVVAAPELEERVRRAIQESLLGPLDLDLTEDLAADERVPDLKREQMFFRKGAQYQSGVLELQDALDFRPLRGDVDVGAGVSIEETREGFLVKLNGDVKARLPAQPPLPAPRPAVATARPFSPPRFGVTTLGRSHGFDPDPAERTTGFILWVEGRGIMVDPPVRSTEILRESDVELKLIDGVLLTHCHADHDAGTLEKALEAGRVTLYTSPSIFHSYQRKWSALSGIPPHELERLFDFRPVKVGAPMDIHGAKFLFRFTLHSIPTLAFEVHLGGRSFNYSSDHLNDPRQIEAIYQAGHMDRERREELLHFNWSHDLIFHESGVPPLHTPLEALHAQPPDVRARTRILHVTPSKLVGLEGLTLAQPGPQHTIDLKLSMSPEARVLRTLALLGRARLFATLPLERAAELLSNARARTIPAGTRFIAAGDEREDGSDVLYVVTGGRASVMRAGQELRVYGLGDYIGETAVFLGTPRSADVFAQTDLEVIEVDGAVARRACAGTDVPELVERHAKVRDWEASALLEESELLAGLTVTQKNELETLLWPTTWAPKDEIVGRDGVHPDFVLLRSGTVQNVADRRKLSRGAILGDVRALLAGHAQPDAVRALTEVTGFCLKVKDLEAFLDRNPGLKVRVQPWTAEPPASVAASSLISMLEDYL
jgi:CRP-like cAMP-binding protein